MALGKEQYTEYVAALAVSFLSQQTYVGSDGTVRECRETTAQYAERLGEDQVRNSALDAIRLAGVYKSVACAYDPLVPDESLRRTLTQKLHDADIADINDVTRFAEVGVNLIKPNHQFLQTGNLSRNAHVAQRGLE